MKTCRTVCWGVLIGMVAVVVGLLASCEKPPAPPPTTRPASPLIACVSGLGNPQLHTIAEHIKWDFPTYDTVDFGTGRDAFLLDPAKYVSENPHKRIVFVAHSYGCDSVKVAATKMKPQPIELLILVDPVPRQWFGTMTIPSNVKRCAVIWADQGILKRAWVKYPTVEYYVSGEHSEICHKAETLEIVKREIAEALK